MEEPEDDVETKVFNPVIPEREDSKVLVIEFSTSSGPALG
jgi:hypothetical protein